MGEGLAAAAAPRLGRSRDDRRLQRPHRRRQHKDKKNFKIVWTNNLYTIDSWVIMKGTPNKADAEKYLAFVNDPKQPEEPAAEDSLRRDDQGVDGADRQERAAESGDRAGEPRERAVINDKFWLENLDKLNQRFNAWVAK